MANFQSNQQRGMGFKNHEKRKRNRGRERESFRQSQGLFADSFLGVVVVVMSREGFIVLEDWMQKKDRNHAKTW